MFDIAKYKEDLRLDVCVLPVDQQRCWLAGMSNKLFELTQIIDITTMAQCGILYYVYKNWSELDRTILSDWDYDFFKWARQFIKANNREPANITIMNRISVYRDYISPEKNLDLPNIITIDNNGNGKTIIPFNPQDVDYGKLLVARGAIRRGEADTETWQALANPNVTVSELKKVLNDKGILNKGIGRRELQFFYKDGVLFIATENEITGVANLIFDNSTYPAFTKAINHLGRILNVEFPAFEQDTTFLNAVASSIDNSLIISDRDGNKFITFSNIRDIEEIRDTCDKILETL